MADTTALRNLIAKRGLKMKFLAESLGLSQYGFQLKVDNKNDFKVSEVKVLRELLQIESLEEMERIFFRDSE